MLHIKVFFLYFVNVLFIIPIIDDTHYS